MNVLEQARTDIQFLRSASGSGGVLAQPVFGDGFLRGVELALLLVVIEDARRRVEVRRICILRGLGIIQKLPQVVCLRQQVEVALHQLRRPERLKIIFINDEALLQRALPIFDESARLHRENLVGGGSFLILGLFGEILTVHSGGIKTQLLFNFERSQRVQLRITGLFLEQISQSRSCLFRRPAKRHFTAWERHPPEKYGFDLRTPLNISNPGRQSTTRRSQPAARMYPEHSATTRLPELR